MRKMHTVQMLDVKKNTITMMSILVNMMMNMMMRWMKCATKWKIGIWKSSFTKKKKPGRREYLRARMESDGTVEIFHSEGSGRISGLAWADGLVELPDGAMDVTPGTPVKYIPYASFR